MSFFEVLVISFSLALDAFAVSVSASASPRTYDSFAGPRMSVHFGLFQSLMPVIGWFMARNLDQYVQEIDHWIAFLLLLWVGINIVRSGLSSSKDGCCCRADQDCTCGRTLLALSVATSIDALVVGLSLGFLNISIWQPCLIIGLVTFVLSWIGFCIGSRLGARFGGQMEIFGGVILIGIGLRILSCHLGVDAVRFLCVAI